MKKRQKERQFDLIDLNTGMHWLAKVLSMALQLHIEHRPNQWNQWLAWRGQLVGTEMEVSRADWMTRRANDVSR